MVRQARFINREDRSCLRETSALSQATEYGNADVNNVGAACIEASLYTDCER